MKNALSLSIGLFACSLPLTLFVLGIHCIRQLDGPAGRFTQILNDGTLTADPLISGAAYAFLGLICAVFGFLGGGLFLLIRLVNLDSLTGRVFLAVYGFAGLLLAIERVRVAFFGPVFHGNPLPADVLFEPFILSFGLAIGFSALMFLALAWWGIKTKQEREKP